MTNCPATPDTAPLPCPLCCGQRSGVYAHAKARDYLRCDDCALIFVPAAQHISPIEEQAHYRLHENDPNDPRYRQFLRPLFDALLPHLAPGATGLDFGCGPGSALAAMFSESCHPMALYDPLFTDDPGVLGRRYAFIVASEVVEHLRAPADVFARLDTLLLPGGWLGIRTGTPPDDAATFSNWHYARDPTHILFYAAETMAWIARQHGWQIHRPARNVTLFHKLRG